MQKALLRHGNAICAENRKSPLDRTVKSCEGAFANSFANTLLIDLDCRAVDAVIILLEVLGLGGFKGDAAALVVGLGKG